MAFTCQKVRMTLLRRVRKEGNDAHAARQADVGAIAPDWLFDACGDETARLLLRIDEALERRTARIVQFIAAGADEGTSSIAWAYARASAAMLQRQILLLSDAPASHQDDRAAAESGDDAGAFPQLAQSFGDGLSVAPLLSGSKAQQGLHTRMLHQPFWHQLRQHYDEVVIDSPALSVSPLGRFIAAHADAVVIVVEAEKTRSPVARQLIEDLHAVRANIIGSVLNKRRFYVPRSIYNRL